ncbi:MAG: ATP-binding protein [Byssovorax sp.]
MLETKVLSLNLAVAGMEKMLLRLLGADIELAVMTQADLGSILADPGEIEQIIMNLAVNARDAMPMGKLTIETTNVELDGDYAAAHHDVRPGAYVTLAVTDTGVGIDAQTQARIFDPSSRPRRRAAGRGSDWRRCSASSSRAAGTSGSTASPARARRSSSTFPRERRRDRELGARAGGRRPPRRRDDPARGGRPQVRALARTVLRRSGYTVLDAANGGEALLHSEQHGAKIDLSSPTSSCPS